MNRKINKLERARMVKAMEYISRQVNDEECFFYWLENGVADEEISYGDLSDSYGEDLDYYLENDHFKELMQTFLELMKMARKSGGLYCDGVVS